MPLFAARGFSLFLYAITLPLNVRSGKNAISSRTFITHQLDENECQHPLVQRMQKNAVVAFGGSFCGMHIVSNVTALLTYLHICIGYLLLATFASYRGATFISSSYPQL